MRLSDVNILIYAHREDSSHHLVCHDWLESQINSQEAFAMSELVFSSFLRIVTNPRIFNPPSSFDDALEFVMQIRNQPNCVIVSPGARHWNIFTRLCKDVGAKGNLVPDAYFAALAIETGSEWVSTDGDFARFEGLRWTDPRKMGAS